VRASLLLVALAACGGASASGPAAPGPAPTPRPSPGTERATGPAPSDAAAPPAPSAEALEAAHEVLEGQPVYRVPLGRAPVRGPATAPITIVAFSDFECRFCARAVTVLEAVRARYGDQLRFAFRHLPLAYHRRARAAHRAAEEARAQGGDEAFWAMHDRIFAFRDLSEERLVAHARALGLDEGRFRAALRDTRHDPRIDADRDLGDRLGVRGTPGFFINGRPLSGAKPPAVFAALIDALLVEGRERLASGTPPEALYDAVTADGLTEYERPPEPPSRVEPPAVPAHAPRRGAADPELVVQIFSDFECPYCERLVPLLGRIESDFPTVQIVWRHFPLGQHPGGRLASVVGAEVRAQAGDRGFWRYHDAVFAAGRPLDRERILRVAAAVPGVDRAELTSALGARRHALELASDREAARQVGVRSTPTILVGGRVVRGFRDYLTLEELIDEELAR